MTNHAPRLQYDPKVAAQSAAGFSAVHRQSAARHERDGFYLTATKQSTMAYYTNGIVPLLPAYPHAVLYWVGLHVQYRIEDHGNYYHNTECISVAIDELGGLLSPDSDVSALDDGRLGQVHESALIHAARSTPSDHRHPMMENLLSGYRRSLVFLEVLRQRPSTPVVAEILRAYFYGAGVDLDAEMGRQGE